METFAAVPLPLLAGQHPDSGAGHPVGDHLCTPSSQQ
jgi:hypothetical protein